MGQNGCRHKPVTLPLSKRWSLSSETLSNVSRRRKICFRKRKPTHLKWETSRREPGYCLVFAVWNPNVTTRTFVACCFASKLAHMSGIYAMSSGERVRICVWFVLDCSFWTISVDESVHWNMQITSRGWTIFNLSALSSRALNEEILLSFFCKNSIYSDETTYFGMVRWSDQQGMWFSFICSPNMTWICQFFFCSFGLDQCSLA